MALNLKLAVCTVVIATPALCANRTDEMASAIAKSGGSCSSPGDTFIQCTQFSAVLGKGEAFAVHLPKQSSRGETCAILLLHGAGRNSLTLISNPDTRSILEQSACVIIFPNGRASWWLDTAYGKYQSYAIELLDRLRVPLSLSSDSRRYAVAGWSMGGFGSLRLIERYPERFAAWAGLLTLADFPNPAYPAVENYTVPQLLGPPDHWPELNPMARIEKLRGKSIWFTTGSTAFDLRMNENLDRRLTGLGIRHEFHVSPGGHEFRVVAENLQQLLKFLESATSLKSETDHR
jgi:putative tributyrin esterase